MESKLPFLVCHLTDANGNILNPCAPDALHYTELSSPKKHPAGEELQPGGCVPNRKVTVSITGYITVSSDTGAVSAPIPFCIVDTFPIYAPNGTDLDFKVKKFHCCAIPILTESRTAVDRIKITIRMESLARSTAMTNLIVPRFNSLDHTCGKICLYANRIYDTAAFQSETELVYKVMQLQAEVSQFNALSDGVKKTYTNDDELKKYGNKGIPSPESVSYIDLYVNGVLQPKANYCLEPGLLKLRTADAPPEGALISLVSVLLKNSKKEKIPVHHEQYNAVSDGIKKIYTNSDELKEYGNAGIPSPREVSYYALYVNGVLQPDTNYRIEKGAIKLTTTDVPLKGSLIILETFVIRDAQGQLYRANAFQYNALSTGKKVYRDRDGIKLYDSKGIPNPKQSIYENLFINSVIQPQVNYHMEKGLLLLQTEDAPLNEAPVSLQFLEDSLAKVPEKYSLSNTAFRKWSERYMGFNSDSDKNIDVRG